MSVFQLTVKGYNDKLHVLLEKIVEQMTSFSVAPKRFEMVKDAVSYSFLFSVFKTKLVLKDKSL